MCDFPLLMKCMYAMYCVYAIGYGLGLFGDAAMALDPAN